MNKFSYMLKNKKFINDFQKIRKNKKYKIAMTMLIFIFFLFIFLTLLFIYPYDYSITIFNNPNFLFDKNLLLLLVGLISGVALATAGCSMQAVTRNNLAGPTTLGFLPVATLGIFVAQIFNIKQQTYLIYLLSFVFSVPALIINFFANRNVVSSNGNYKIILVGIIFGALISSINAILASWFPAINANISIWIGGGELTYFLGNFRWEKFLYSFPIILLASVFVIFNSKKLNIIESDINLAINLGIKIKRIYWTIGLSSILLTIAAVNLVGSIVIIGTVIPHLARMLLQTKNYYQIIPTSSILTGTILMIALYVNNYYGMGVNLYASIISAPIFCYLIFFRK